MFRRQFRSPCECEFRQIFRWAGGRPLSGLSPVVVVFHSQSELEKLWAIIKGNLREHIAYQFYGVIQIYPRVGEGRRPAKLQEQLGKPHVFLA